MFSEIVNDSTKEKILAFLKEKGVGQAKTKIEQVLYDLNLKHNETYIHITTDATLLKFWKLQKRTKELQEGVVQLYGFATFLQDNFTDKDIQVFINEIAELANSFQNCIVRFKDRITAILEVLASFAGLIIAIVAIVLSVISIVSG